MDIVSFTGPMGSGKTHNSMEVCKSLKGDGGSIAMLSFADPLKTFVEKEFGLTKNNAVGDSQIFLNKTKEEYSDSIYKFVENNLTGAVRLKGFKRSDISTSVNFIIDRIYDCHNYSFEFNLSMYKKNIRDILQVFGTDVCRVSDDNFWSGMMFVKLSKLILADIKTVIIDDLRFVNEYNIVNNFAPSYEDFKGGRVMTSYIPVFLDIPTDVRAKRLGVSKEVLEEKGKHSSENYNWVDDKDNFIRCTGSSDIIKEVINR